MEHGGGDVRGVSVVYHGHVCHEEIPSVLSRSHTHEIAPSRFTYAHMLTSHIASRPKTLRVRFSRITKEMTVCGASLIVAGMAPA